MSRESGVGIIGGDEWGVLVKSRVDELVSPGDLRLDLRT